MDKVSQDKEFVEQLRKNYLALKLADENKITLYQLNTEEKFIKIAEDKDEKVIPQGRLIDSDSAKAIYRSG